MEKGRPRDSTGHRRRRASAGSRTIPPFTGEIEPEVFSRENGGFDAWGTRPSWEASESARFTATPPGLAATPTKTSNQTADPWLTSSDVFLLLVGGLSGYYDQPQSPKGTSALVASGGSA